LRVDAALITTVQTIASNIWVRIRIPSQTDVGGQAGRGQSGKKGDGREEAGQGDGCMVIALDYSNYSNLRALFSSEGYVPCHPDPRPAEPPTHRLIMEVHYFLAL
jgi:hypothetical protein